VPPRSESLKKSKLRLWNGRSRSTKRTQYSANQVRVAEDQKAKSGPQDKPMPGVLTKIQLEFPIYVWVRIIPGAREDLLDSLMDRVPQVIGQKAFNQTHPNQ
jgi:hypothetical protein